MNTLEQAGISYRVFFSYPPPPNLTKSQVLYKFFSLGNLGGGQLKFIQGLGLSQIFVGGRQKKNLCTRLEEAEMDWNMLK